MAEETQTQIQTLESGEPKKATSKSRKAGLVFPVRHVVRSLKAGKYSDSIGFGAPIYLAAVLEYVAAEVLELAGNAAIGKKKTKITPEHIKSVLEKDEELKKLLGHINIDDNGNVVPNNNKHSILPLTLRKKVNCSKLLRRNSKRLLGVVALATGLYLGRVINNFN